MEKTRLPYGKTYYYVYMCHGCRPTATSKYEKHEGRDSANFRCGNYFLNREDAWALARKLRAVLNGAEVIEMPSEGIMKDHKFNIDTSSMSHENYDHFQSGFIYCYNWLKHQIVK